MHARAPSPKPLAPRNMERRKIRLTFVATGESVLAEMLDDEAPEVCRLVWDLLPIETRAIHGMYSGAEVFTLLDNPQPVPPEALTQLPLPGEILYFYDASKNVDEPPQAGGRDVHRLQPRRRPARAEGVPTTRASSPASPATGNTTGPPSATPAESAMGRPAVAADRAGVNRVRRTRAT